MDMKATQIHAKTTDQVLLDRMKTLEYQLSQLKLQFLDRMREVEVKLDALPSAHDAAMDGIRERLLALERVDKSWLTWEKFVNELAERVSKLEKLPLSPEAKAVVDNLLARVQDLEAKHHNRSVILDSLLRSSAKPAVFVEPQQISNLSFEVEALQRGMQSQALAIEALRKQLCEVRAEKEAQPKRRRQLLVVRAEGAESTWNPTALASCSPATLRDIAWALAEGRVSIEEED